MLSLIEMGRSSVDAEVRPKNSAECSAEEFGRMFGLVRLGNVRLFGRSSAELRQTFGVIGTSNWQRFALAAGIYQSQYTYY